MIIGDMETDGYLDKCTKIHCAVFHNIDSGEFVEFTPANADQIPAYLDTVKNLSMHNGLGFDLPVLKKLYNYTYNGNYIDTLLMSRVFWPDKKINTFVDKNKKIYRADTAHGVENWGIEFKCFKPEHEDWSKFTPEMLHRCKKDVIIQTKLYLHCMNHLKSLQKKDKRLGGMRNVWLMEQKVWQLIEQQAENGWSFDLEKAYSCIDELTMLVKSIDKELVPKLPLRVVLPKPDENGLQKVIKPFKADGELNEANKKFLNGLPKGCEIVGEFCRVGFLPISLSSADQVKDYLLSVGWKPKVWNFKKDRFGKPVKDDNKKLIYTSPKKPAEVEDWEEIAENLKIPAVALLAKRSIAAHRLSSIKGFIKLLRQDHKISARANTCSANTTRMTHKGVVNVPKADGKKFYGKEMRSLFKASEGHVLVGCDASALEARCEAHYIYPIDPVSANELIEGDIHTKNADIFGVDRNTAKSGKYAILYGCGVKRLAETLKKPESSAQQLYDAYWSGNPGLKILKARLEDEFSKFGYILAIDGRPLTVRYKHALVNTLFQSCGSIAMKIALCFLEKNLRGVYYVLLGNFHDEIQLETRPELVERVKKIMVESLEEAGRYLKLNVPLTGEAKSGADWSVTH